MTSRLEQKAAEQFAKKSLLDRTAEVIYLAATSGSADPAPYEVISKGEHLVYEQMAIAALTVAFREPMEAPV